MAGNKRWPKVKRRLERTLDELYTELDRITRNYEYHRGRLLDDIAAIRASTPGHYADPESVDSSLALSFPPAS